jgi:hypothetical protein
MAASVDNGHARSEHPLQGSTPASHVWTRQLNSQATRMEKRQESFLAVQPGGFVNAKTWPEHGGTRPGIVLPTPAHLVHVGIGITGNFLRACFPLGRKGVYLICALMMREEA